MTIRCRPNGKWLAPTETVQCKAKRRRRTECGQLGKLMSLNWAGKVTTFTDGEGDGKSNFHFDTAKVESRCNNNRECFFYCKGQSHLFKTQPTQTQSRLGQTGAWLVLHALQKTQPNKWRMETATEDHPDGPLWIDDVELHILYCTAYIPRHTHNPCTVVN